VPKMSDGFETGMKAELVLSRVSHSAIVLAILGWNIAIFYLATLRCPVSPGSSICGFSWPPELALLVGIPATAVELTGLLLLVTYLSRIRVGPLPQGLSIRTRLSQRIVPWNCVRATTVASGRGLVLVEASSARRRSGKVAFRVRMPSSSADALLSYREQVVSDHTP
jgi:hypothetical protein